MAKVGGQNTWASYPYTSGTSGKVHRRISLCITVSFNITHYQSGSCKFKSAAASIGAKVNKAKPATIINNYDITTMMSILSKRGVVDIGFYSAPAFDYYRYKIRAYIYVCIIIVDLYA